SDVGGDSGRRAVVLRMQRRGARADGRCAPVLHGNPRLLLRGQGTAWVRCPPRAPQARRLTRLWRWIWSPRAAVAVIRPITSPYLRTGVPSASARTAILWPRGSAAAEASGPPA